MTLMVGGGTDAPPHPPPPRALPLNGGTPIMSLRSTAALCSPQHMLTCVIPTTWCCIKGPATGQEYPRPETPDTPAVTRAKSLVAQMTDDEKVAYTNGVGWGSPGYYDIIEGFYVGNIPGVPRLNIPSINMQDAAQGFRTTDPKM